MSGSTYYVPEQSKWPILASVALGLLAYGAAMTITSMTADRDSVGPLDSWRRISDSFLCDLWVV